MKNVYILLSLLTVIFTSCFDDEGNYTYENIGEIVIEGIEESYDCELGSILEIDPKITSEYTDLQYEWYMWDISKEDNLTNNNVGAIEGYEAELISTEKKLSFEVQCPAARYTIMLKVYSASSGYFSTASTRFDATSEFSRGFYILKETADGNTELDLGITSGQPVKSNLFQITGQEPMMGKPLYLSHVASHSFINTAGDIEGAHTVCVTTEEGDLGFYETKSLLKVHDRSNVMSGESMTGDQKAYAAFTTYACNIMLTNTGSWINYVYGMMPTSGAFYMHGTGTNGGSQFLFTDMKGANLFFWDEQNHCVANSDAVSFGQGNGVYDNNGYSTDGMDCLACGAVQALNKGYFLLEDASGKRYLHEVLMSPSDDKKFKATNHIELDPNSKFAQATEFATNELTTAYIYFIYNNQLYIYNLSTNKEEDAPVTLEGISSDETITYLAYQWQDYRNASVETDTNFTYLVVGTQKGDTYRLYMYSIESGRPKSLKETYEGNGKLKMCLYVTPVDFSYGYSTYSLTN